MATSRKRGNSYQLRCSCGYRADGSQNMRTRSWVPPEGLTAKQTQKELARQLVLFEQECKAFPDNGSRIKLEALSQKWLKSMEGRKKDKTILEYRQLLVRINYTLGSYQLDKINKTLLENFLETLRDTCCQAKFRARIDLRALLAQMGCTRTSFLKEKGIPASAWDSAISGKNISAENADKIAAAFHLPRGEIFCAVTKGPLSNNTVNHYLRTLSAMLEYAVSCGYIQTNPAKRCHSFRCDTLEMLALNPSEAATLFELLDNEPIKYRTAIKVLLLTGLRRGELLGLQWQDIDFANACMDISRSLQYIPKKGLSCTTPKTVKSQRWVALSEGALQAFQSYYESKQAEFAMLKLEGPAKADFIFSELDGRQLRPNSLTSWFHSFIKKHPELPPIHVHSLRHTNASLLIEQGIPVTTVAEELGHSRVSTTLNIYGHALKHCNRATADTMDKLFNQDKKV